MRPTRRADSERRESRPHRTPRTRASRRNAAFAGQYTPFPDEAILDRAAKPALAPLSIYAPVTNASSSLHAFGPGPTAHYGAQYRPGQPNVAIDSPSGDSNNLLLRPFFLSLFL